MSPSATMPFAAVTAPDHSAPTRAAIDDAALRATRRIAPLWPLKHFVAVNPFFGLADHTFDSAAGVMSTVGGGRMTMPRAFYADAIREGRVTTRHLALGLDAVRARSGAAGLPADAAALEALAVKAREPISHTPLQTVADVVGTVTEQDWARFVGERFSFWASAYFDEGQASWTSPWRDLPPYGAWQAEARHDRSFDLMGARGFRAAVGRLPVIAADATAAAITRLGIPLDALEGYLHRLLITVGGWAAYARYQVWESELHGGTDDTLAQLLAVRLGMEVALLDAFATEGAREAWTAAIRAMTNASMSAPLADLALQEAYEVAWQEQLVAKVSTKRGTTPATRRPLLQAAFCIDVRSEVFRRALEAQDAQVDTIGFAGFFGFPIEYIPVGQAHGGAQCPVLLTPTVVIAETVHAESADAVTRIGETRMYRRRVAKAWKGFKQGAISCFSFVGPVGLLYARKLVTDTLGMTRTVAHPAHDGVYAGAHHRLGPTLEPVTIDGRTTGLAPADRLAMAEVVLKAMSMTENFARVVVLAGHGSTTVNNPHATGLDCGACGGHTGEANARVAVAVLNDPGVRTGLGARGLSVPADTVFVAALHDTTTDEVRLYAEALVPASHADDLARVKALLAAAAHAARAERAPALQVAVGDDTDALVIARSRDWSQVRPEWGLAGCAAFIAAPRHRTAGLDLAGRSFLHSYQWQKDEGFGVLELIMTAPMVVASWISLQYYGSTVDNRAFGSGNKALHNVVGTLGVFEGNGGDLRTGLPWQSVHDGERFVHEPLRLNVVIEAPMEAMNAVIAKHAMVRELVDNGWLHLWALGADGTVSHRYVGELAWQATDDAAVSQVA